jgi:signal transduction histidine kinase
MSLPVRRVAGLAREYLDPLLAAGIAIELELECWLDPRFAGDRPLATVAIVLFAAPIAWRLRWPVGALAFSSSVMTIQALLGNALEASSGVSVLLGLALLTYSVGATMERRSGLLGLSLGAALFSGFIALSAPNLSGALGTGLFILFVAFAAPWFIGRVARGRTSRATAFGELAAQAAAEQDERMRAAIATERARIGGELQDIIAHSVSAMVIQATAARRVLRSDAQSARESILAVERTGREALADLRRLLGMLRKDDDPQALTPQPGLGQLAALLARMADGGLACELTCEGEPIDLTPGIDLVSYRVIESALASAERHQTTEASVAVRYQATQLELEVRGDGAVGDARTELAAMCERVALYDGSLRSLAVPNGGFALRARLPLEIGLVR